MPGRTPGLQKCSVFRLMGSFLGPSAFIDKRDVYNEKECIKTRRFIYISSVFASWGARMVTDNIELALSRV